MVEVGEGVWDTPTVTVLAGTCGEVVGVIEVVKIEAEVESVKLPGSVPVKVSVVSFALLLAAEVRGIERRMKVRR